MGNGSAQTLHAPGVSAGDSGRGGLTRAPPAARPRGQLRLQTLCKMLEPLLPSTGFLTRLVKTCSSCSPVKSQNSYS